MTEVTSLRSYQFYESGIIFILVFSIILVICLCIFREPIQEFINKNTESVTAAPAVTGSYIEKHPQIFTAQQNQGGDFFEDQM